MLVPISWLKEYVAVTLSTPDLVQRLTLAGLEIAAVHQIGDWWDPKTLVVGQVQAVLPHPDADRLVLVDVHYGGAAPERVVTGAPNLYAYREAASLPVLKVAFAREGAVLIDAYSDQKPRPKKQLKASKIRGVRSAGMVCSERELGMSEEHDGILLLPEDAPVGTPLRDYLGDEVLEVELTPDMARCLSVIGIAREVAALTNTPLQLPSAEWQPSGDDQVSDYVAVQIADPSLCQRYTALLIRDVQVGPSPQWLQERLTKAGMRPINNIVDITNYVMLEWGQPLHAFDYDVLVQRAQRVGDTTPTIIVKRAAAGEKFTTLDDLPRTLDDSMLMIADTAGSVAIAGVMGGQESEVSTTTRTILLESATFEGINNRRTASQLRLPSEASYRFARGVPATLNPIAARLAAELMRRYAGGRIVPGMVDAYPVPQPTRTVYTTVSDTRRLLGMAVTQAAIVDALRRLDFQAMVVDAVAATAPAEASFALHRFPDEPLIEAIAPWHRLDVAIPADLTEEVARIIGYEHVGTTLIDDVLPTQRRHNVFATEETVRDILAGIGLQEIINHALTSPESHAKLHGAGDAAYVTLLNPIMPERRVMRRSLIVSTLENLARNLRHTPRLTTFEVGRVYLPEAGDGVLPQEDRRICLAMTGPRQVVNFYNQAPDEELDFFDLKGVVALLLQRLGYDAQRTEYQARPDTGSFGPRCAEVFVDGRRVGLLGELHPQVRAAFELSASRIGIAELRLEPLLKPQWELQPMQPISTYPPVVEDLAFEVTEEVTAYQVQQAIRQGGDERLVAVELFDIYRGEPLPVGHKSMAYRLTYQSLQRSLNEKEVSHLRQRIIRTVESATGAKLRG
ncbi:MAG: phenylalanine--tRNA ligase subunit beta [Caldilineaceae bacterium]|nr:phenylalanine--tRNA ligase subunit beta [Caldilineaceae bacterium]